MFEKLYWGEKFIFFKSIKTIVQNNVKIDYLSKFKTRKRKLKPTDDFEKEPNFTTVFFEKLEIYTILKILFWKNCYTYDFDFI